jgi:hypothetical protein
LELFQHQNVCVRVALTRRFILEFWGNKNSILAGVGKTINGRNTSAVSGSNVSEIL